MKKTQTAKRLLWALVLFVGTSVSGQDFGQLLEAVDRLETTLKARVESESEARKQEVAQLRKLIEQMPEGTSGRADQVRLTQLVLEVKALRSDVDRLAKTQPALSVTESDLLTVIDDIEYLRSEVELLQAEAGANRNQLASIDAEGFYVPSEIDPRIAELTDQITELNASVEGLAAGGSQGVSPNPSVKHGKIGISGFVHEHFLCGPDQTSSFVSKNAQLIVTGEINDYTRVKIQGQFAGSPKLVEGFVTISPHRQWSLSVGQYTPPFGTDFLILSTVTPFVNKSKATGLGTGRDIGASISFRHEFNPAYSLKLTTGLFNGSGINSSDANDHKNFVARMEVALFGMFVLSPNVYAGKTNEVDSLQEDMFDVGGALTWQWRHEIIRAECVFSERGTTERSGWYVWGGHTFPTGLSFLQELQVLARYEQYDPNAAIHNDRIARWTMGTNLLLDKKYTKLQVNYQINTEQAVSIANNEFVVNVQVAF